MLFMKLADAWYSSSAALFVATGVLIVLTLALLIFGILAWLSARPPRLRLTCILVSRTRLVTAPEAIRDELQVLYHDEAVRDPHVAAIELRNTGKVSISSNSFDDKRSAIFKLDAKILKVLSVSHAPKSAPTPKITGSGDTFQLAPELIVKGESIETSVLTDGPIGDVSVALNPFAETKIETSDRELLEKKQRRNRTWGIYGVNLAIPVLIGTVGFGVWSAHIAQLQAMQARSLMYDGRDPQTSTCPHSGTVVDGKPALYSPVGSRVGYVELIRSSACSTVWARIILAPSDAALVRANPILITMIRPADKTQSSSLLLLSNETTNIGNMLSDQNSCVLAQVKIITSDGKRTGPEAITACR